MNLKKTISLSIFLFLTFSTVYSQNKKFDFFGSFNYGLGNLTAKVSSSLGYPFVDEVKKLKSGTTNQFEFGAFYHKFGLGFIHNSYVTNASTNYKNADVDSDGYFEDGILSDKLNLSFNGLELLYQIPLSNKKFDVTWKIGLGFQSYSINKDFNLLGARANHYNYSVTGNRLTTMAGVEINYQLWKMIGIGLETSILPGNYTKLKRVESSTYISNDNVTRLSTGLKIKITI